MELQEKLKFFLTSSGIAQSVFVGVEAIIELKILGRYFCMNTNFQYVEVFISALNSRSLMLHLSELGVPHLSGSDKPTAASSPSTNSAFIQLATVLRGVRPLAEKGVNDSFRGQLVLDNGSVRSAIIKDLDAKQLANELMAAALADAAKLPIPKAHIAKVPPGIMRVKKGPSLNDGSRLVFGSEDARTPPVAQLYVGKDATVQRKVRERLSKWSRIGDLYGFDSWIANTDRHEHNLLFSGDKDVWLIDHGHCFTGPKWTPTNFDPTKVYSNKLKGWLTPAMSDDRRNEVVTAAAEICERIKHVNLQRIGELNRVVDILDSGDFNALVDFLAKRNAHVPRLAADALNFIV